jgi:hypothetical protein
MLLEDLEGAVVLDGLNDAIIGTARNKNFECVLVYAIDKIMNIIMARDQMTLTEAREFYDFNIDAHYGNRSPIFIEPIEEDIDGSWAA